MRAKKEIKLIQIISNDRSMTGLASDGSAWVYVGKDYGWTRLNMSILTRTQADRAMRIKYRPDFVPDE